MANNMTINELAVIISKSFSEMQLYIDKRFDQVDKRFDRIEQRLDTIEPRLTNLTSDNEILKEAVASIRKTLEPIS